MRIAAKINGTFDYFGYDALGSQVVVLNTSGALIGSQLYGPYGPSRYSAGTLPTSIGFTGQQTDSVTGLDYFNARYYDPVTGQFLSADTVQGNAQGTSPYAYVMGNPETRTDPTGHMYTCDPSGGGCGSGGVSGGSGGGGGSNPCELSGGNPEYCGGVGGGTHRGSGGVGGGTHHGGGGGGGGGGGKLGTHPPTDNGQGGCKLDCEAGNARTDALTGASLLAQLDGAAKKLISNLQFAILLLTTATGLALLVHWLLGVGVAYLTVQVGIQLNRAQNMESDINTLESMFALEGEYGDNWWANPANLQTFMKNVSNVWQSMYNDASSIMSFLDRYPILGTIFFGLKDGAQNALNAANGAEDVIFSTEQAELNDMNYYACGNSGNIC